MATEYRYFFSGSDRGSIAASLYLGDEKIADVSGLRNERTAKKWASSLAKLHKLENTPGDNHFVSKSVSGSGQINL